MNKNKKTFQFLGVITVLLGLNLMILGKAQAEMQTATLAVQPGNLTLAVPRTISFQKLIIKQDEPVVGNIFLDPFDSLQTIQVIDPSTGDTFRTYLTFRNMSIGPSAMIQGDPTQEVGPFTGPGPVDISVGDAGKYFANDTIIVNQQFNGGNEHMRVTSVDTANNLITVLRGVDSTDIYASPADPIAQGAGFTTQHIVPFSQFKVITLHGNNQAESVDTSSAMNNPAGLNNVSSPISFYYNPITSTAADYPDANLTAFPADPTPGSEPLAVNADSLPVTLMERTVNTPSSGIYSVGLLLRATIPAGNPSGNFSGELTFTLDSP